MPTNEPLVARKLGGHPCFDADAKHTQGRAHLPVAPACNVQCNYCNRDYDCVAESRPGVTSTILQPWQAERYFDEILEADPSISVAGIAGPGDALASADATLSTLRRIHEKHPETLLCVATNGLALPQHAEALAAAGVSHVTVTVNAIDPEIGKHVLRLDPRWAQHPPGPGGRRTALVPAAGGHRPHGFLGHPGEGEHDRGAGPQ